MKARYEADVSSYNAAMQAAARETDKLATAADKTGRTVKGMADQTVQIYRDAFARRRCLVPADAFYDRPADLASLEPGEIVRTRTTSIRSLQVMPLNVDAWQLAYRTTGMNGEPDLSVTTVMVPRGKKPTKLLSYQAAADSTLRICQSSYATTKGGPIDLAAKEGPLTFGMPGAELLFAGLATVTMVAPVLGLRVSLFAGLALAVLHVGIDAAHRAGFTDVSPTGEPDDGRLERWFIGERRRHPAPRHLRRGTPERRRSRYLPSPEVHLGLGLGAGLRYVR